MVLLSFQGPREPWRDIHCRVEGPVVRDVYQNFRERWEKQAMQGKSWTALPDIDEER